MVKHYYEGIGVRYYDLAHGGLDGDVPFYVDCAQEAGSPVLELGCGSGRITLPVARAGVEIVGLDLSPAMLAVGRERLSQEPPDVQARVTLVEGDMSSFALAERFSLVMIPFRAFLHMDTVEKQKFCLRCIHQHLAPGGLLVFNVFDPRLTTIVGRMGNVGEALTRAESFVNEVGHRVHSWESRRYDAGAQTVHVDIIYDELNDDDLVISRTYETIDLRWLYRWEMHHLLELCGFEVAALYGDFERGPFRHGEEQVWVARKV